MIRLTWNDPYKDSRRITQLIKIETSIVEASINGTKKIEEQMNKRLTEIMKALRNNTKTVEFGFRFTHILIQYDLLMNSLNDRINLVESIILQAQTGHVDPQVIKIDPLVTILKHIATAYGEFRMMFPVDAEHA